MEAAAAVPPQVPAEAAAAPQAPGAAVEAGNYMDGNSVRFHRKGPLRENAEFVRDGRGPRLPTILSQKALLKKLEDRRKASPERAKEEADAAHEDPENVVDYQHDAQPDRHDEDYKEMDSE
ncbi:hypothetical protein AAVH_09511 [Aphelenchoides avenae]|nr:hypothetical protein AAVH_09511 [Aphelenchus avenae]